MLAQDLQQDDEDIKPSASLTSRTLAESSTLPGTIEHPINRLPPEIRALIFHAALPIQPLHQLSEPPFNVSATCRSWRGLALSTPALWSQISIGNATEPVALRTAHVDIVEEWISRSKTLPLSISLKVLDGFGDQFERLARILSSCRTRWEVLSLHLPITCLWTIFEGGGVAPRLRELKAVEAEHYLLNAIYVEFRLDQFPALEKVDFFGCFSHMRLPHLPAPCFEMRRSSNLVSKLRIARVGLAHHLFDLFSLLAHSPFLEELEVEVCVSLRSFELGHTWKDPIRLPLLRRFWIQFLAVDIGSFSSGLIFDHLFTPNLKELIIADSGSRCSDLLRGLPAFFTRSRPSIRLFSFEKFVGDADRPQLIDVLRHLPSLEELKLQLNTFLSVEVLVALDSVKGLLPALQTVNLDPPVGFAIPRIELQKDVFTPLLATMVKSRHGKGVHSFQRIRYNGQCYEDVDGFLSELNEDGPSGS